MQLKLVDVAWKTKLPEDSGVYRYYNDKDELLYVGKAINLKKRVLSYFQKSYALSPRIAHMVSKISYIELTVTENESSALILENNFIKNLHPRYNILFVDDKSYPYIKISKHEFPVLEYYRGKVNNQENFFGPYPNSNSVKQVMELLQKIFLLRTCSNSEFNSRSRPCMLYQIKRCSAPCVGYITTENYNFNIKLAKKFLSGDYSSLIKDLSDQMYIYAEEMNFEKAAITRDQIAAIKDLNDKQVVSTTNIAQSYDLVLIKQINGKIYFYLIYVKNGLYVGDNHYLVNYEYELQYALECFLEKFYYESEGAVLYVNIEIEPELIEFINKNYRIKINSISTQQKQLAIMGFNNLDKIIEQDNIQNIYAKAVVKLSEILGLKTIKRIECYDISHHGGVDTVGAMTVFQDGVINSKLYRKYNLENTKGNDLAALEIVLRRRLANSDLPLPQVILIDGGSNQYHTAKNIINELGFCDKIVPIAIFKGEKRKELNDSVIVNENTIIGYTENQIIFKLLQPLRDEAHRFSITAHRNKKIKSMTKTKLSEIPNIGASRRKLLLAHFGDVHSIANASIEDLMQVDGIGLELAKTIIEFFRK